MDPSIGWQQRVHGLGATVPGAVGWTGTHAVIKISGHAKEQAAPYQNRPL